MKKKRKKLRNLTKLEKKQGKGLLVAAGNAKRN